jgi:hypothetical protein
MIDLAALERYLQSQGSPLTLSKDDAQLPAELREYLGLMPNGKVTLTPTAIALKGVVLTVTGGSTDVWPVEGMKNVSVTLRSITFTLTNADNATKIEGLAGATLPLSPAVSAAASVASFVKYDEPGWKVSLDAQTPNVSPLQLIGLGALGRLPVEVPQQVTDLLNSAVATDPSKFEILFYPGRAFSPWYAFGVYAPGAQWTLIQDLLSFDGISLVAGILEGSVSVVLASTVTVGASTQIEIGVSMNTGENWSGFVRPPAGKKWPGLIELASKFGGSSLGSETQQGFSGVGFTTSAFDLELSLVELGFNWKQLSLDYLKVASKLTIVGAPVTVLLSLPDLTIAGGLTDGQPVKIVDMLKSCNLSTEGVPTDLEIETLAFSAQLKQSVYAVAVGVKHVWKAGPVELEEIYAGINYSEDFGFTGEFAARVKFETKTEPIVFGVQAIYQGKKEGWVFSGANDPATPIHIGRMIEALAKEFKIESVPKPVESLTLESISVSYATGTGTFTFECIGTFEVVSDQPVRLTVKIEVTSNADKYKAHFGGRMEVNELQFDVQFDTEDDEKKLFVADYVNKDASSNTLKSLISAISEKAGEAIPANLKIDIREVKLVYYSTTASKWLFGLGLGIEIKLSEIPGIGSKLPSEFDIGIEDLQISYASEGFSAADVIDINPLLPDKVRPLPKDGLEKSVSFDGKLKLGDKSIPIKSPVPEKKTVPALAVGQEEDPVHWININRQFGVFQFDRIGVEYSDNVLSFALDAGIAMGPVIFNVVGLKVGSNLSRFDPVFDLSGLALALTLPSLTIGGAFLGYNKEYYGQAMVQSPAFGFKVIGGWSPSYTDDKTKKEHPSSFFLYANIQVPLGGPPFFFVTGLAGGFGLNRKLRLPTIQELPGYQLLPANAPKEEKTAIETVKKILPTLANDFPEVEGQCWLAAGIQFKSFEMIHAFALVTVSWGVNLEIAFFGSCAMSLPPGPAQIAYVEILIIASFSTETGLLAIAGVLSPASYVFAEFVQLTGGFAFYTWVSGEKKGDFVVTIGGYGPGYAQPDNYPTVPRVGMSMALALLQVSGQTYFALTPGMLMAGMEIKATFTSGPILAWFDVGVDFLLSWAPFHYEGHAWIVVGVGLNLGLFTIKLQIGADLFIWGPDFGGRAEIDLAIVQFTIFFGASPSPVVPLGWTSFAAKFLPKPNAPKNPPDGPARAHAAAVGANTNVIKVTVTHGLQKTVDDILVLDPDGFSMDCASTIPANEATWNPGTPIAFPLPNKPGEYSKEGKKSSSGLYLQSPPKEMSATEVWNPDLAIGPMEKSNVRSLLEVTLIRHTDGGADEPVNSVRAMPILLNSPSALWAPSKEDKSPKDPPHVKFTLVGFTITPPVVDPSAVNDVPLKELLFQSDFKTGFQYQSDWSDPNYTVTSTETKTPTETTLKITIDGKHRADLEDKNYYLSSLTEQWVATQRGKILDDLIANKFSTYIAAEVRLDRFAREQALTDWPQVEMIGK